MRAVETVKIAQIDHGDLPINKKALWFALQMKLEGVLFPPIELERKANGRLLLKNGRHRLTAHKLIGRDTIRAKLAEIRS